ncbi:hypothetical protein D9M72_599980 [compost metagenome]
MGRHGDRRGLANAAGHGNHLPVKPAAAVDCQCLYGLAQIGHLQHGAVPVTRDFARLHNDARRPRHESLKRVGTQALGAGPRKQHLLLAELTGVCTSALTLPVSRRRGNGPVSPGYAREFFGVPALWPVHAQSAIECAKMLKSAAFASS